MIQAAGRGYPWIHLTDGRLLETTYKVDGQELRALRRDDLEPLSLVAGDLDEDGTQDLIAGYATSTGGLLMIYRSNPDAIYPNSKEAQERKRAGTFTDAPFLSPAQSGRGQPATTELTLVNPNGESIDVDLTLFDTAPVAASSQPASASPRTFERTVTIAPKGFLHGSVSDVFGISEEISSGYVMVEVTSGPGAIGFVRIQLLDQQTVIGLNAQAPGEGTESFSAQLAAEPGVLFTNTSLINTSLETRVVTLTALGEDGSPLGDSVVVQRGPGEQFDQDAGSLFIPAFSTLQGSSPVVGSLKVESDGPGVIGDVIFGDPLAFEFAAALPLQSQAFRHAVFSQVANITDFFTGLAFFNPGEVAAQLTIRVVTAEGVLVGETTLELGPGQRRSKLVPELIAASAGQAGGYVEFSSDQALIAQQLFGALGPLGIRMLSAVPPTSLDR